MDMAKIFKILPGWSNFGKPKSNPAPYVYCEGRVPENSSNTVTSDSEPASDVTGISPSEFHFQNGTLCNTPSTKLVFFALQMSHYSKQFRFSNSADFEIRSLPYVLFLARRPPTSAVPRDGSPAAQHRHMKYSFEKQGTGWPAHFILRRLCLQSSS